MEPTNEGQVSEPNPTAVQPTESPMMQTPEATPAESAPEEPSATPEEQAQTLENDVNGPDNAVGDDPGPEQVSLEDAAAAAAEATPEAPASE